MSEDTELEVMQRLVTDLEDEGYEVYSHPNRLIVPEFLGDFSPDIIAKRFDKNLIIEIKSKSSTKHQKSLDKIAELVRDKSGWELRIVWITPNSQPKSLQIQDSPTLQQRIAEVKTLVSNGHPEPAMLLAWATFEALARAASFKQFSRPQTPGRIVQMLASEGYLTPSEADFLRTLISKRNRFIHGDLQVEVFEHEITSFSAVLETMLNQVNA